MSTAFKMAMVEQTLSGGLWRERFSIYYIIMVSGVQKWEEQGVVTQGIHRISTIKNLLLKDNYRW